MLRWRLTWTLYLLILLIYFKYPQRHYRGGVCELLYIAPKLGAVADGDNILREVVPDHNGVGKGKTEVIRQAGYGLGDFAGRIKPWRNVTSRVKKTPI